MTPFVLSTTRQIAFGAGSAAELGQRAGAMLGGAVLLVTDPGIRRLGLAEPTLASLEAVGIAVTIFDRVEADPSRETLLAAVEAGRAAGATGIVGFGGGSSLDVAKLVALLLGSGEDSDGAWGVANAKGPRLAAGAGADHGRHRVGGDAGLDHDGRRTRSAACRAR